MTEAVAQDDEAAVDESEVDEPVVDEPVVDEPAHERGDVASPERRRGRRFPGYLTVFVFALLLLLCAAAAAALANFRPNTTRLAWASIWLSGAAVVFTAAALFIRAPRS